VGVGTNLDSFLLHWMLLSGRLLLSRGGVIPGLALFSLSDQAVRRCWAALSYGCWETRNLVHRFEKPVVAEGRFQPHAYGGYRPVAGDLTGFFRPSLKGCKTKHYSAAHGKALSAIPVGRLARIGSVEGKRLSPCWPERSSPIWPLRNPPFPPASGIDLPNRLPDGSGES
jgi:hypothetical protein